MSFHPQPAHRAIRRPPVSPQDTPAATPEKTPPAPAAKKEKKPKAKAKGGRPEESLLKRLMSFKHDGLGRVVLITLIAGLIGFGVTMMMSKTEGYDKSTLTTLDGRFKVRGPAPSPEKNGGVRIVAIDDKSQDNLSEVWPFPRSWSGQVVANLNRMGARVVDFDIFFNTQEKIAGDDALFATSIRDVCEKSRREAQKTYVILGSALRQEHTAQGYVEEVLRPSDALWNDCGELAVVNQPEDNDSVVRKETMLLRATELNYFLPGYSLHGVSLFRNQQWKNVPLPKPWQEKRYKAFERFDSDAAFPVDKKRISKVPMNDDGQLQINYYGPQNTFKSMSFMDALLLKLDARYLLGVDANADGYSETKDKFIKLKRVREELFNPFRRTVSLTLTPATTAIAHDDTFTEPVVSRTTGSTTEHTMKASDEGFFINDLSHLGEVASMADLPGESPIHRLKLSVQAECQQVDPLDEDMLKGLQTGALTAASVADLKKAWRSVKADFEPEDETWDAFFNRFASFRNEKADLYVKQEKGRLRLYDLDQHQCFELMAAGGNLGQIVKPGGSDWLEQTQAGFFFKGGKALGGVLDLGKAKVAFRTEETENKDSLMQVVASFATRGVPGYLTVADGALWVYDLNQNRVTRHDPRTGEELEVLAFAPQQVMAYQQVVSKYAPVWMLGAQSVKGAWHEDSKSLLIKNPFTKDLYVYQAGKKPRVAAAQVKLFNPTAGAMAAYVLGYDGVVKRLDLATGQAAVVAGLPTDLKAETLASFSFELMEETESDPVKVQVEKLYLSQQRRLHVFRVDKTPAGLKTRQLIVRYVPKGIQQDYSSNIVDLMVYGNPPFEYDDWVQSLGLTQKYPETGSSLAFTEVLYEPDNEVLRYAVNAMAPAGDGQWQRLVGPNWVIPFDPYTDEFVININEAYPYLDNSEGGSLKPLPITGVGVASGKMHFVFANKIIKQGGQPAPAIQVMGYDNYRRGAVQTATFTEMMGGTLVMIGPTAEALHDNFPTPFYKSSVTTHQMYALIKILYGQDFDDFQPMMRTAGVEIHANAAQTLLDENYLVYPDKRYIIVLAFIVAILGALMPQRMSQLKALGMSAGFLLLWWVVCYLVFIGVSLPVLCALVVFLLTVIVSMEEFVPITLDYYNGASGAKRRGAQFLLGGTALVFATLLVLFALGRVIDGVIWLMEDQTHLFGTAIGLSVYFLFFWGIVFSPQAVAEKIIPKFLWAKTKSTQDQEYHLVKAQESMVHSKKVMLVFVPLILAAAVALYLPGLKTLVVKNVVLDMLMPPMAMFIATMLVTVFMAVTEGREKNRIKGMFSKYVNAEVVDQLLSNPEGLGLGGKALELTIFFSDIRGFTSISERMTAPELVTFLNEYLTAMTDIVFKYGGTLDKYIGDAVMAFWGAPFPLEDHAERGVRAGVEMQHKLAEMREMWAARGQKETIKIGCGLNTGVCVAGNIGSEKRMDYTVIGDTVNLAARLESITKQYGVGLIVSENTLAHVKDLCFWRALDKIIVKGKTEPVAIFQVLEFKQPWAATQAGE